jgi:hypothetical protein
MVSSPRASCAEQPVLGALGSFGSGYLPLRLDKYAAFAGLRSAPELRQRENDVRAADKRTPHVPAESDPANSHIAVFIGAAKTLLPKLSTGDG